MRHHRWIIDLIPPSSARRGLAGSAGRLLALAVCLCAACAAPSQEGNGVAQQAAVPTAAAVREAVLTSMDAAADPCEDPYRYACGGWLDANPLPEDKEIYARSFSVVQDQNREHLRRILEADRVAGEDPSADQLSTFYDGCMNEGAIAAAAAKPLQPWFDRIAAAADERQLAELVADLQGLNVGVLFVLTALPDFKQPDQSRAFWTQGGMGLPTRDDYFADDERSQAIRDAYREHARKLMLLAGFDAAASERIADHVLELETALAEHALPPVALRQFDQRYHLMSLAELGELSPSFDWGSYLRRLGVDDPGAMNVSIPEFFAGLSQVLAATDRERLGDYLRFHLLHTLSPLLDDRFVAQRFSFESMLTGQRQLEPRWQRCIDLADQLLGDTLGRLFVESYFAGDSGEMARQMVADIEAAFEDSLADLSWMDDTTRARALQKARALHNKVGFPKAWRDYSSLRIVDEDLVSNYAAAAELETRRVVEKINAPVDPEEWNMTAPSVNAYYNPTRNEIVFPAGILQPPFFDRGFPAPMIFGRIGAVVGHELTHGFDDQGRRFDPQGRLQTWWEPEAEERFEEAASCIAEQYSGYEVDGIAVDGRLTLGENIADLGGLKQAHAALQTWWEREGEPEKPFIEGLSDDQLFFVAFLQNWCVQSTPETRRLRLRQDFHALPRLRASGVVRNVPEFAEAFACAEGSAMRPAEVCEVW